MATKTPAELEKEFKDYSQTILDEFQKLQNSIGNTATKANDNFFVSLGQKLNKLNSDTVRNSKEANKAYNDAVKELNKIAKQEDIIAIRKREQLDKQMAIEAKAKSLNRNLTRQEQNQVNQIQALVKEYEIEEQLLEIAGDTTREVQERIRLEQQLNILKQEQLEKEKISYRNINLYLGKLLGFELTLAGISTLLFNADKSTTKLANNLGISRKSAQELRNEFSSFVRSASDVGLSTEKLIEAQLGLSQELGIAVRFSNEELQTFNTLTKVMGVSSGAAAKLNLIAKSSGTEYKNIQSNILKGAIATKNQLGVAISNKDVFEEIGKLSAGILVKFQNNPTALGAAVVEAKKLGLTLEQVNSIGESLLNFESSIENELKAELLTNRELNLERARAAALTGDQATLMAEVAAQAGSLEDFTKLNVIAQGALAGAFGMTGDQMAEMLMKQELINQYGDEAAKLNKQQAEEFKKSGLSLDEYLKKQGAQVELQEQFNNSIEQLKELLVTVTQGPFGALIEGIAKLLDNSFILYTTFAAIATILTVNMAGALATNIIKAGALLGITKAQAIAEKQAAIGAGAAAAFKGPMAALTGGIAGVIALTGIVAAIAGAFSSADDMIQPGYGKRILFSPEGSIAFNDKDTIVAGTDLQYGNDVISGPAGSIRNVITPPPPPPNNDGLMAGIKELINVTKQGRISTIDGQVFSREGNRVLNMYTSPHYS
jgi:hypothetical protein